MTLVPHSVGLNRPQRRLPAGACDSHMHIFDPRFAPSAHWPRTPPVAPVVAYRQLRARLGTARTVVVTPSSSTVYTISVTGMVQGALTVSVGANAAQDAALNGNTASNTSSIVYGPHCLKLAASSRWKIV